MQQEEYKVRGKKGDQQDKRGERSREDPAEGRTKGKIQQDRETGGRVHRVVLPNSENTEVRTGTFVRITIICCATFLTRVNYAPSSVEHD